MLKEYVDRDSSICVIDVIIYKCLQNSNVCEFELLFTYLYGKSMLPKRICSLKIKIFCKFEFTFTSCLFLLELYRKNRMFTNFPASARNFFLFLESIGEISSSLRNLLD